jgi:copper chaperone NosL
MKWAALQAAALWLAGILLWTTAACGAGANAEPTPPTIHYGEDVCEACGMIASEARHAAAYVTRDGHAHIFDDIGDMAKFHVARQEDVVAFFVHDYEDKEWIRAEAAHYVRSVEVTTPMLSGLAAFASPEEAKGLAAQLQAQVLTFDELLTHYHEVASMTMQEGVEHTPP